MHKESETEIEELNVSNSNGVHGVVENNDSNKIIPENISDEFCVQSRNDSGNRKNKTHELPVLQFCKKMY